jgi:hypothetical protein
MEGGLYFMCSRSTKEAIPQYIDQVESDLKAEEWDAARQDVQHLDLAWRKVVPFIQFHAEMDQIDGIKSDFARLNGSIDAEDLGLALSELGELAEHWENLKD